MLSAGACAGLNVGFGGLLNRNLFSDGAHTVQLFDDGTEFASAEIVVTTLGSTFLTGASGIYSLANFPSPGQSTLVRWDQNAQNFLIMKDAYYKLQTQLSESRGECLESNSLTAGATLSGASFMDTCGNFSGQLWKLYPNGSNFTLQTADSETRDECLEGNAVAETSTLGGAAFMDSCGNFTGQLWKLVPQ